MEINIENIRLVTRNAQLRKQQEEEERKRQEEEKRRLKEEAERNRAHRLINDAIKNINVKAENGENKVMVLRIEKYGATADCTAKGQKCFPHDLSDCALMVYNYFKNERFNVEIVYNHDGVGVSDWFNMWVSW